MDTPTFDERKQRLKDERKDELEDADDLYYDNKINTARRDEMKKSATDSYTQGLQTLKDERNGVQRTQAAPLDVARGTVPEEQQHSVIVKVKLGTKEVVSYALVLVESGETFVDLAKRVIRLKLRQGEWDRSYVHQPLTIYVTTSATSTNLVSVDASGLVQSAVAVGQTFVSFTFSPPPEPRAARANGLSLIMKQELKRPTKYTVRGEGGGKLQYSRTVNIRTALIRTSQY